MGAPGSSAGGLKGWFSMMHRKRAVDIAAKLPLADLLSTIDHAYADYATSIPSTWQSSTLRATARQMSSRVSSVLGECRCTLGDLATDRSTAMRLDALIAENDRLRRAISNLAIRPPVP